MIEALTGDRGHTGALRTRGFVVHAHCTMGARTRRFGRTGLASIFGALVLLLGWSANGLAIGLGPASLNSALGEPLRLSLPVTLQDGEDVGCVQVRPHGDDLPSVFNTRASVVQVRGRTQIEISSGQPVDEPAIGVVVSVGCASPVARDYVLFLDPPVIPAIAAQTSSTQSTIVTKAPTRVASRSPAPRRLAHRARRVPPKSNASQIAGDTRAARRTNPRTQPPAARITTRKALPRASRSAAAATSATTAPRERDRLTVAPTEPQKNASTAAGVAGDPARAIAMPPAALGAPATSASVPPAASLAAAPSVTPLTPAPLSSTVTPPSEGADAAALAAAREEQLHREQTELQKQVKALTDQINALRVQSTTLATRNQTLEAAAFSPALVWLLIALAAIAIAVAGWMALRYAQLRRSVEGSAWWSGNTVQAATSGAATARTAVEPEADAIHANTRSRPHSPDTRTFAASAAAVGAAVVSTSNVQDRPRAAVRNARYPAAMETDFTVSDIEAAMATVRTVSSPRSTPRPAPLDETDYAGLGGPTLPSPFADPPPAASPSSLDRPSADARAFADLGVAPIVTSRAESAPPISEEETMPLDFKLDIPQHYDDPLATNSMKTTIVDRPDPPTAVDIELPSAPTPLDFELASTSIVMPLSASDDNDANHVPMRRAATALDDIFPSLGSPGVDTILNLDERDGAPLITTEVDRLMSTEVEGTEREAQQASTRFRLVRFADLMHQVEDAAQSDPLRSIAMLRQYVLRDEQIPTLLWLRLFELYKQVDKKPVYEALGEHFARRYHRAMVGWNESLADRVAQKPLTAMVEIDRDLEARWGSHAGLERLRSLLCDRNQPDAIVFNAVLQRDLLDAAKTFPLDDNSLTDFGGSDPDPLSSSR